MISTMRLLPKATGEFTVNRILPVFAKSRNNFAISKSSKISQQICFLSQRAYWCNHYPPSAIARNLCIRNSSVLNKDKNLNEKVPENAENKDTQASADLFGSDSKMGLIERFKLMYKKYWYVLIPVHVVTSLGWLSGFYYLSKSGVDLPSLLQYLHLSESVIQKAQNSEMAHYAIAYICYKVITPVRYAMSLGGTTISIKYLAQAGYIKPIPTGKEFMNMYNGKKKGHRDKIKEDTKEETN